MKNDDVILLCDHAVFQGEKRTRFYGLFGSPWAFWLRYAG